MTTNGAAPVAALVPERRWPMAVAVLATIVLQVITPHNGRLDLLVGVPDPGARRRSPR